MWGRCGSRELSSLPPHKLCARSGEELVSALNPSISGSYFLSLVVYDGGASHFKGHFEVGRPVNMTSLRALYTMIMELGTQQKLYFNMHNLAI
jgi:hypothetical protein